jgi:hypothetical protein
MTATRDISLDLDFPLATTVSGSTVHAPNGDFLDDTKRSLLSRTVRRILALGYGVAGVYYDSDADPLSPTGWVRVWSNDSGLLRKRTHLLDVESGGEIIGTVEVRETLWRTATLHRGFRPDGSELWQDVTEVRIAVVAPPALVAQLRS